MESDEPVPEGSRWEVIEEDRPAGGGPFELELRTLYHVRDRRTGARVLTFEGLYEASWADGDWGPGTRSGVTKVEIAPDDSHAVVHRAHGPLERVPLPPK